MATQQGLDDDALSLDGDEVQAPAVPTNQITTTTTSFADSRPARASAASTAPPAYPALARLNARVDRDRNDPNDREGLKFAAKFEPHFKHPSTVTFEAHIGTTIVELADFWFCQGSPYDHVCLARFNWRAFRLGQNVGEFFTRAEFHLRLYAYTLRRMSAVGILLARGYELLKGYDGLSATDEAFKVVVEALVHNWDDMHPYIVDWPERGRPRTVMIDHPRLLRALEIVIGNGNGELGLPMRFAVKWKAADGGEVDEGVGGNGRRGASSSMSAAVAAGRAKVPDEVVFFSFTAKKRVGQVDWETEMEAVAPRDEDAICPRKEYELPDAI